MRDRRALGQEVRGAVMEPSERLRGRDRFWYEIYLPQDLLSQVRSQSLAKIIRRNTEIGGEIQNNVFIAPGNPRPMQGRGSR